MVIIMIYHFLLAIMISISSSVKTGNGVSHFKVLSVSFSQYYWHWGRWLPLWRRKASTSRAIYLSVYLAVCLLLLLLLIWFYVGSQKWYRPVCLCLSIYLYIIYISVYLPTYIPACLPTCLSACLSVRPSIHPSTHPSFYLSIYLSI